MNVFRGVDFYRTNELLSEDERMVRDTVREWVSEKVVPIMDRHFEDATFPVHLIPELAKLGVFGANLPEECGCAGMNNVAYGLVMQELERGDSALRSFASVQGSLVMYPIYEFGSEEQKRHWIPQLARGEKIGCFGLTEPDRGSDPGNLGTRAVKKGNQWILTGAKSWITNGTIADLAVVWAKHEGEVRGFLVEKGTKGFSAPEIKHKMSLRASITSQLIFDDCLIPEENLLPKSQGLLSPLLCLNQARYGIAWGVLGAAMACYESALDYSQSRIQFEADRQFPAGAGQAGLHADGNHKRPAPRSPSGQNERPEASRSQPDINGEKEQYCNCFGNGQAGTRHPGSKRHQSGISCNTAHVQSGGSQDIRRDSRHSHPDHRPVDHGPGCLPVRREEEAMRGHR
jgi:glutaryl-CoA dehydrogenase